MAITWHNVLTISGSYSLSEPVFEHRPEHREGDGLKGSLHHYQGSMLEAIRDMDGNAAFACAVMLFHKLREMEFKALQGGSEDQ